MDNFSKDFDVILCLWERPLQEHNGKGYNINTNF